MNNLIINSKLKKQIGLILSVFLLSLTAPALADQPEFSVRGTLLQMNVDNEQLSKALEQNQFFATPAPKILPTSALIALLGRQCCLFDPSYIATL